MTPNFEVTYRKIMQAVSVEDLFGADLVAKSPEEIKAEVTTIYRKLSKDVHPDLNNDTPELADKAGSAFHELSELYEKAKKKAEQGLWGQTVEPEEEETDDHFEITLGDKTYHLKSYLAEGDVADLYYGRVAGTDGDEGRIVAKIVADPQDNDLIKREINALKAAQFKHLPVFMEKFKTSEGKLALIIKYFDGFDFKSIHEKYPNGVENYHLIWILMRALSGLNFAHKEGLVHCNIEPTNIMVRPRDHNVCIVDWAYSVLNPARTGQKFAVVNPEYSPPEVQEGKSPIPASDIYSLGKSMIYLAGGDISTDKMPASVAESLQRFFQFMVTKNSRMRPQDSAELYYMLKDVRKEVCGNAQFLEFKM